MADPVHHQTVVESENLEAHQTLRSQPRRLVVCESDIARPRTVRRCRDHCQNSVAASIKVSVAQHKGWPPLGARLIAEWKGHNYYVHCLQVTECLFVRFGRPFVKRSRERGVKSGVKRFKPLELDYVVLYFVSDGVAGLGPENLAHLTGQSDLPFA
jgi:hypothetical protein